MENQKETNSASPQSTHGDNEVGVPGLFQPGRWDIEEELSNNEALREYRRDQEMFI